MVWLDKGRGGAGYLKKELGESRWQRVARYRLGGGMRGGKYWMAEEKRKCRVCGVGEETWEYVWEECADWRGGKSWQEMVGEVLGDEGEGESWLRELEGIRGRGGRMNERERVWM